MSITKKLALRHLKQNKNKVGFNCFRHNYIRSYAYCYFYMCHLFAHYYGERAINTNGNWHFFVKTGYESAKNIY